MVNLWYVCFGNCGLWYLEYFIIFQIYQFINDLFYTFHTVYHACTIQHLCSLNIISINIYIIFEKLLSRMQNGFKWPTVNVSAVWSYLLIQWYMCVQLVLPCVHVSPCPSCIYIDVTHGASYINTVPYLILNGEHYIKGFANVWLFMYHTIPAQQQVCHE